LVRVAKARKGDPDLRAVHAQLLEVLSLEKETKGRIGKGQQMIHKSNNVKMFNRAKELYSFVTDSEVR